MRHHDTEPAHPDDDAAWDEQARDETTTERLDRNWGDLIQELRVVQTGVQFLTGFLLTLPFQQKFTALDTAQRTLYLCTVGSSVAATAFLQAPVSVHRALFRRHQRRESVLLAHRLSIVGIVLLGLAIVGVTVLIFDVVAGGVAAAVAATCAAALLVGLWGAVPLAARLRGKVATTPEDTTPGSAAEI